jgi:hypothetical protein
MRYFFRPFSSPASLSSQSRNPISPTLQSTLCLKAGAKILNDSFPARKVSKKNNLFSKYFKPGLFTASYKMSFLN